MIDKFKIAYQNYSLAVSSGDYIASVGELSHLISLDIQTAMSLSLRSHLYSLSDNMKQAIDDLNRAIELSPKSGSFYYDRANLFNKKNEHYRALKDLVEAANIAQSEGDDDLIDSAEHILIEIFEKMRSE